MYKIYNNDCFDIFKKIKNNSIDLILTDMPYMISKKSNFQDGGGSWDGRKTLPKTDFGDWDKEKIDIDTMMYEFHRILKNSGTLIVFYDIFKINEIKEAAEKYKLKQPRLCIWQKTNPIPVNSKLNYLSNSREYFITFVKKSKPTFHSEYDNGFYSYPICHGLERTKHPTQKPLSLINDLILKHSNQNDLIFDPFMGSGTTGISAITNNRRFIGVEKDKDFFEIAKKRLESEDINNEKNNNIKS